MLKKRDCGDLRLADVSKSVELAGWVHRRRDHGGLVFIDLRDRSGLIQVVFNPEEAPEAHCIAEGFRGEWVVTVTGMVSQRPEGTQNAKMATGEVEVLATAALVLSPAKTPPFYINEDAPVDEMLRLEYRYLDLRKERMQRNLMLRHRVTKYIRDFLDSRDFIEVETPMLIKSTPEGARDYLVPSRVSPGQFYALPQSPQQLKQLLMVSGLERYYQIARCFRDEDLRADRQPEFTQLDLEMSFVEEGDILDLMEELFTGLVETVVPELRVAKPFPRLTYSEAMDRYGSDKPDLRYGLELVDISDLAIETDLSVFKSVVESGGIVKGFAAPGCADYGRAKIDELIELAKSRGAKGLVPVGIAESADDMHSLAIDDVRSTVTRFLTVEQVRAFAERLAAHPGDLMLFVAGDVETVSSSLSYLRSELGTRLELGDRNALQFAFITEFPLMDWNEEEGRWDSLHHPFTAIKGDDLALLETAPDRVRSTAYDMVCNGHELASGSIRIHDRDLQSKIFRLLGHDDVQIEERFGHLLRAFEYGVPPHGGIAYGLDRLVMLLAQEETIREIIAFPKTQSAGDPMTGAPSSVSEDQLKDLGLKIVE